MVNWISRRELLSRTACGFGAIALQAMLADQARGQKPHAPLAPKAPHFAARAKRLLFLYLEGGASMLDLVEYKPELEKRDGQKVPFALPGNQSVNGLENARLMGPLAKFRQRGQSGLWVSDLLPHLSKCVDDLCYLPATVADNQAHHPAHMQLHTGVFNQARPSWGAWLTYGLGTENQSLPGFVTISPAYDNRGFGGGFLPTAHQGTLIRNVGGNGKSAPLIQDLTDPTTTPAAQRQQLELLATLNQESVKRQGGDQQMEGMIEAFELAFRMQAVMPGLADFATEPRHVHALYGTRDTGSLGTANAGLKCLLARRLLERGVRCVQVTLGGWDHHDHIRKRLPQDCKRYDQPIAALLMDLKRRGLLSDTLVMISGEFGRTPWTQDPRPDETSFDNRSGRDHHPHGYTTILAGGGVKGGHVYGATDEFGFRAVEGKVRIPDLHATLLHLLGLDHERLTFNHAGRNYRLTDVSGQVVREVLA
jgi:hypothetical protein